MQVGDSVWILQIGTPSSRMTEHWPYLREGRVTFVTPAGSVRYVPKDYPKISYIIHNRESRLEFMFLTKEAALVSARDRLRRQYRSAKAKLLIAERRSAAFETKYQKEIESWLPKQPQ